MTYRPPEHRKGNTAITRWLLRRWRKLPASFRWNIEDTFQPEDIAERLLPGEEPVLEIKLAWYRDIISLLVFRFFFVGIILVVALTFGVYLYTLDLGTSLIIDLIPLFAWISLIIYAIRERVEYEQWRLLKTNLRLIISIPQPGAFPLVDNIELVGSPRVIDTNWSRNPVWRVFQFFTGARDVYLSLSAYRFIEGTARVGDALIIPDVMPKDVFALKRVIFGKF